MVLKYLSIKYKIFLSFILFTVSLASIMFLAQKYYEGFALKQISIEKAPQEISDKYDLLALFTSKFDEKLLNIEDNKFFRNFAKNNSNQAFIKALFISCLNSDKYIFQFNYIDISGQEILKVQRIDKKLVLLEKKDLHNIKHKSYFNTISSLPKNQIWYSPIILSTTLNGQVQKPIKPILKIATTVYDNEKPIGVLKLVLEVGESLKALSTSSFYDIYIIDKNGEFLIHPNNRYSWGKYLKTKYTIFNEFPQKAHNILKYTNKVIDDIYVQKIRFNNNEGLKIILKSKDKALKQKLHDKTKSHFFLVVVISALSLPIGYLFSIFLYGIVIERDKYKNLSSIDKLTNIYNRRSFEIYLAKEVEEKKRYPEQMLSLIFFDIDHFKKVNDNHGHDVGDDVIKGIAEVTNSILRESDIFARWGGEEFIIIARNTNLRNTTALANKLREKIDTSTFGGLHITCSYGVTEFSTNDTKESLIKRADEYLYDAKQSGRNIVISG